MARILKALACAALGIGTLAAAPAFAADAPKEARIPFANRGGIDNWRAVDRDTLLIESRNNRWYRAELFSPCLGLPYANIIGFVTNPGTTFDRFSKIVVRGETCQVRSLVQLDQPPARKKKADA